MSSIYTFRAEDTCYTLVRALTPLDDPLYEKRVKRILVYDIYKKYNIDKSLWTNKHIYTFSINVLRELLVFGEHEHIINKIKSK